ncbi:MAG: P-loop NTPase [bacterium]|nr:P-loop NTPase [bacterium]
MSPPSRPLLDRRLHVVVGKGGVGKTTVTAALARLQARRGLRTLAVEMDAAGRLPRLLGLATPPPAGAIVRVAPNLHVTSIEGRAALEEYLGMIVPVKRLLQSIFSSRVYQYFVAAAPGLKELMTVGKIWFEATREEDGRPVWDVLVVDAPATGHSLQVLRMPQAARDTFGAGLVQREAARIVSLLQDPTLTAVHLVTLPEEMPVTETLETEAQLRDQLGMPRGLVVANRVRGRHFDEALLGRLDAAAQATDGEGRALLHGVAARAREESGWAAIHAHYLGRLRAELGDAPLVELPFVFVEEFDAATLERLSRVLADGVATALGAPAAAGAAR